MRIVLIYTSIKSIFVHRLTGKKKKKNIKKLLEFLPTGFYIKIFKKPQVNKWISMEMNEKSYKEHPVLDRESRPRSRIT